jgi:hypothetical protein
MSKGVARLVLERGFEAGKGGLAKVDIEPLVLGTGNRADFCSSAGVRVGVGVAVAAAFGIDVDNGRGASRSSLSLLCAKDALGGLKLSVVALIVFVKRDAALLDGMRVEKGSPPSLLF